VPSGVCNHYEVRQQAGSVILIATAWGLDRDRLPPVHQSSHHLEEIGFLARLPNHPHLAALS